MGKDYAWWRNNTKRGTPKVPGKRPYGVAFRERELYGKEIRSMQNIKYLLSLAALSLLLGCNRSETGTGGSTDNQSTSSGSSSVSPTGRDSGSSSSTQPDNTGKNVRDRSDAALTSGDQGGSESDRETTRRIRRALTSNDQLSTDAKNIKVISLDGKVTLRGPVNSPEEQKTIDSIVKNNGGTTVDDQLEVKAPKTQ